MKKYLSSLIMGLLIASSAFAEEKSPGTIVTTLCSGSVVVEGSKDRVISLCEAYSVGDKQSKYILVIKEGETEVWKYQPSIKAQLVGTVGIDGKIKEDADRSEYGTVFGDVSGKKLTLASKDRTVIGRWMEIQ